MTDGNAPVARGYPVNAPQWRKSKYTEGPNSDGYYTAGIDVPKPDSFGKPDWHHNAIEFHSKDKAEAERRRDLALSAELLGVAQSEKEAEHKSEMTAWQCVGLQNEIKRLSGLLADAQKIIAEYQAGTIAGAKADVAAHGMPGARGQRQPDPFMEDYKRDTIAGLIEKCANIAEAIDSGRGNEKQIAAAIRALVLSSTDRLCAKCGCTTKGEEALVSGEIWCHPCADNADTLRSALKPFAAVAESDIGQDETDTDIFQPMRSGYNREPLITVGDMRRAALALSSTGRDTPEGK